MDTASLVVTQLLSHWPETSPKDSGVYCSGSAGPKEAAAGDCQQLSHGGVAGTRTVRGTEEAQRTMSQETLAKNKGVLGSRTHPSRTEFLLHLASTISSSRCEKIKETQGNISADAKKHFRLVHQLIKLR